MKKSNNAYTATKLELMQLIPESKNKELLNSLLNLIHTSSSDTGKRVKLTKAEREAALKGPEDFENGRYMDFEEFAKEFE